MVFFFLIPFWNFTDVTNLISLSIEMPAGSFFRRWLFPRGFMFLVSLCMVLQSSRGDDFQLLMQFKSSLKDESSRVFDSWTTRNRLCNFTGIVCDSNRMVKEISLPQEELSGIVSFDSVCGLESLEKLDLGANFLYGRVTDHLRNCSRLEYLDLSNNSFSGEFPDLSVLNQLKFLNLNATSLSGRFPWKSLENMTSLGFLSLGDNVFEKSPFPLEVLKLEKLYWLYLTNASIEGEIPEGIGNLTLLENLQISQNSYLSGKIPDGITKLTRLWELELHENQLTGKIPVGFGNLTNLVYFDASANYIEGDISELKSLTQLQSFQMYGNNLSGEIPVEFGEFKSLVELSLYRNRFTGTVPQKIGSWAPFQFIDISENFFTGPIPPDMCKQGQLTDLLVLQNKFTGGIPGNYAGCSTLVRLRANNNSLSGTVPVGIWSLPSLEIIDLRLNQFEGPIASGIGEAKSLAQVFLANNRFNGPLPERLSEASSLVSINLSSNNFSGGIPENIGELKKLNSLILDHNLFSGNIPVSIGSCVSLNEINLAGNSLSGEIPASIGSLTSLNSLNLSDNQLSGEIPVALSSLRLSLLDFSNNRLTGHIPSSLSMVAFNGSFSGNPGLCSEDTRSGVRPCSSHSSRSKGHRTVIICLLVGIVVLIILGACFVFTKSKHKNQQIPARKSDSWNIKQFHILSFSEDQVVKALKQENLIGKGGSGNVYKIVLDNGKQLAVKHIWKSENPGADHRRSLSSSPMLSVRKDRRSKEYDAEVAALSSIRHVNVVKLYCSITSEDSNLLVYEYLPNGSLWDRLHSSNKTKMDWLVRYEIALGAARGLEYLHHGCDHAMIHRDVKSCNILLDEKMKPKIADFGLAKILEASIASIDTSCVIAGTHGYIAPEYAYTSKVNEKSDVYSFGVVLMELVTGKKPVEPEFGENNNIAQWVCSRLMGNKESMMDMVDSSFSVGFKEDAVKVLKIAMHCTARLPSLRPSMRMVVQMLEDADPCKLTGIVVNSEDDNEKF
ncbi:receptor-like protein kinase 7 [Ipomoea triloba]|uniref:receptor-like protein kinase 7 n=1 Tax=Ipomoea triloba TaxID=35885 RepID=UPI00125DFCB7|nr:receptor-like protein kinase 7 [Ipomoea triloba]XP_031128451.1 receptor-like protein kinase 7 [Ipomoea triloba]